MADKREPCNAGSIDGFPTLKDALTYHFDEGVELPDLTEFWQAHEKAEIHLYRRIASIRADSE
jgi:hypothetical protein